MLPEFSSLFEKLQREQELVGALVESAQAEALCQQGQAPGGEPGWSAREMLAHLVSAQLGMLALARTIANGQGDALPPGYDVDAENAKAVAEHRGLSAAGLLSEWERGRAEWKAFLEAVTPEQSEMTGRHPASLQPMTLRTVVIVMLRHERGHHREMVALLTGE
jgi:hypothetical protein